MSSLPSHTCALLYTKNIDQHNYAQFRRGVAHLKIETGRYGVNKVPVE